MKKKTSRLFYGWYVLASAAIILFFVQGARTIFGVIFKPLIHEFGWSRSAVSMAAFLNMTIFALALTAVGRVYDRYGAKWVIVVSTLFLSAGFIGASRITTLWQFLLLYGGITAIGFAGTSIPLFGAVASKWFYRYRGLAISLTLAGGCLGQYVLVPAVAHLVTAVDWRNAFMIIGLVLLFANLLCVLAFRHSEPRAIGLRPYGIDIEKDQATGPSATEGLASASDFSLSDAIKTRSFWLFLAAMFVCGGGDYLFLTHLIPMATDYGVAPTDAGKMMGWAGLFSLAGVLITGPLTDRLGNKMPMAATFVIRVMIFGLIVKSQSVASIYVFAMLFGFTMLITAPICTTLLAKLYGITHLGLLTGFITTVHHLSGGLWSFLAGVLFDRTGDYHIVFLLYAALSLVALVCSLFIREEKHAKP